MSKLSLSSFFLFEVQQDKRLYLDNFAAEVLISFYLVHSSKGNCYEKNHTFILAMTSHKKILQSEKTQKSYCKKCILLGGMGHCLRYGYYGVNHIYPTF